MASRVSGDAPVDDFKRRWSSSDKTLNRTCDVNVMLDHRDRHSFVCWALSLPRSVTSCNQFGLGDTGGQSQSALFM